MHQKFNCSDALDIFAFCSDLSVDYNGQFESLQSANKVSFKRIALDQQIGKFRSPQIPGLGYILGAVCRWRGGARRRVSHVTAKWLLGISLHPHIWNLQLSSSSATVSQIEHWMLLTVLQWWIFCPRTFPIHIFFCTVFYQGLDYSRILLQCTLCVCLVLTAEAYPRKHSPPTLLPASAWRKNLNQGLTSR